MLASKSADIAARHARVRSLFSLSSSVPRIALLTGWKQTGKDTVTETLVKCGDEKHVLYKWVVYGKNPKVSIGTGPFSSRHHLALLKPQVFAALGLDMTKFDTIDAQKDTLEVEHKGRWLTLRDWYKEFGTVIRNESPLEYTMQVVEHAAATGGTTIVPSWRFPEELDKMKQLWDGDLVTARVFRKEVKCDTTDMYETGLNDAVTDLLIVPSEGHRAHFAAAVLALPQYAKHVLCETQPLKNRL